MTERAMLEAPTLGIAFPGDCTMRPAPYGIGRKAAQVVLELLARREADAPVQTHIVPCKLVVRGSSRLTLPPS